MKVILLSIASLLCCHKAEALHSKEDLENYFTEDAVYIKSRPNNRIYLKNHFLEIAENEIYRTDALKF